MIASRGSTWDTLAYPQCFLSQSPMSTPSSSVSRYILISLNQSDKFQYSCQWEVSLTHYIDTLVYPYLLLDNFTYIFLMMLYSKGMWPSFGQWNVMGEPLGKVSLLLKKEILNFANSHPSVSKGDWFQDLCGYQNPWMLNPLYKMAYYRDVRWTVLKQQLLERGWGSVKMAGGNSRVCLYITSLAWTQCDAWHLGSSSFAFWNFPRLLLLFLTFSTRGWLNLQVRNPWIQTAKADSHRVAG